jgi:metallophosphoesterase superfamily enzyme
MLILNDIHIGVQRKGGTTPASQEALRSYLFTSLRDTLLASEEDHLCILGDLFDTFEVSPRDWIETYMILSQDWILRGKRLALVAGNHDHSPKALKVSAFQMLCDVLTHGYGEMVQVIGIDQFAEVMPGVVALAHCSNQDLFDLKLKQIGALEFPPQYLLLHANFDNNFAAQSDHSLNVSREQASALGMKLVFAHEHQARTEMGGQVVIMGNQWPTSIADCLNNDKKYAHILKDGAIERLLPETWCGAEEPAGFCMVDWRDLGDAYTDCGGFFRVEGEASSNEAGEVVSAIARFRSKSLAYVVSNAVKIDGIAQAEDLPETFEAAKTFDVMTFIKDNLEAREFEVVQTKLIKEQR